MRATLYADFELLIFASLSLNVVASPLTMGISQSNEFMYPGLLGFGKPGGLLTNLTLTLNSLIKLRGNEFKRSTSFECLNTDSISCLPFFIRCLSCM